MNQRRYHFIVAADEAGLRLDVFLNRHCPQFSRSALARMIRGRAADIGGRPAKPGLLLRAGEAVSFSPPPPAPSAVPAQPLELDVLYQDEALAVVNKPAGMVTHPAPGHSHSTLVNALLYHLDRLSGIGDARRPGIVHRLDKDTSGLLLVAKNDAAHRALATGIQTRAIRRWYDAVVWGQPEQPEFRVETLLGRDPKNRKRIAVLAASARGKPACTFLRVQKRYPGFALLQAGLETGRTHQIRVHCRHLGLPVVGDRTYGKSGEQQRLARMGLPRPGRQLLHARCLEFVHPVTGKNLRFEAPWPEDFADFVRALEAGAAQPPARSVAV